MYECQMVWWYTKTIDMGCELYHPFVLSKSDTRQVRVGRRFGTDCLMINFRLLAERLLTFYLMPWDVNTDDKVKVLLTLYSNVDENAQR